MHEPGDTGSSARTRRTFIKCALQFGILACTGRAATARTAASDHRSLLAEALGMNTSSISFQLAGKAAGRSFSLLELPRILRDELDLSAIDLGNKALPSTDDAYLDKLRTAVDKAGCTLGSVKIGRASDKICDLGSHDSALRQRAILDFKRTIDITSKLGTRWARPHPGQTNPDSAAALTDAFSELSDYAAERGVGLLVENVGCIGRGDPNAIVKMVQAVGRNIAGAPDIGNWPNDEIRFAALAVSFPVAATCDFKFIELEPDGRHPRYDLKKCFTIGWNAGFRGPWNFEHRDQDTAALFRKMGLVRDQLRTWIAERNKA